MRYILIALLLVAFAGSAVGMPLLVDRGLPSTNLNNAAGALRSNVTWASEILTGFTGDDFTIGTVGQFYVIDSLTVWGAQYNPLSDDIDNIWLYLGRYDQPLALTASGVVTGNTNSNANISHTFVTYADGITALYEGNTTSYPVCKTTFSSLNLLVEGGVKYKFGVKGDNYLWWNHASNAALSGTPQDCADDKYLEFDTASLGSVTVLDSNGYGWDKSSDINVQITGVPVTLTVGPGGLPAYNFATIQAAIDAANPGDAIMVAAGNYHERLRIWKPLTLLGAQHGVDPTASGARTATADESVIDDLGTGVPNPDVLVEIPDGVSDVTLSGFTLIGSPTPGNADKAVVRCWDNDITIQDNIVSGFYGALYKGPGSGLVVRSNRITANKVGVVLQPGGATSATVSGNEIVRGAIPASDAAGIYLTGCNLCNVNDNVITGFVGSNGIGGSGLTQTVVSGNTLMGNKKGISFWGNTTFITISGNAISGSVSHGIEIKGADLTIQDNAITSNGGDGVKIDYHTILTQRVAIHNNSIAGNAIYGVEATAAVLETVNAESNWWGSASGPSSVGTGMGDKVSARVDFDPWLGKPAQDNVLFLVPSDASIYIKRGQTIIVDMNIANLLQDVKACQAMLGFDSSYFTCTNVTQGGGVWDDLIYSTWTTTGAGEIDTAIGVHGESNPGAGTSADGTVAKIVFTAGQIDGSTQIVFRPDASPDPGLTESTFLSDMLANPVWPAKVNSTNIIIDGTAPTGTISINSDATYAPSASVTLTLSASDALSGIDKMRFSNDNVSWSTAEAYATSKSWTLSDGDGEKTVYVEYSDKSGNTFVVSDSITLDATAPIVTIGALSGTIAPSGNFIQGDVTFTVDVDASVSGEASRTVKVDETVILPGVGGVYTFPITETTVNGTHTITAAATDNAGNIGTAVPKAFEVNKNRITVTVNAPFVNVSRLVTFYRNGTTDVSPAPLSFTGGVASYTFTDVPDDTETLSAKTAWTLRQKVSDIDMSLSNGQAVASFTLRGGDLNGSNSINVLDYTLLKTKWYTDPPGNAAADIDGDTVVGALDYSIMKTNWFKVGEGQ